MFISQMVLSVLESKLDCGLVLADWLQDYRSGHPEALTYQKRLQKPLELRLETLVDIMTKFGERWERKFAARVKRLIMKMRNIMTGSSILDGFQDINSLFSRRRINGLISMRRSLQRTHKAIYLKSFRVTRINHKTVDGQIETSGSFLADVFKRALEIAIGARLNPRGTASVEA